MEKDMSSYLKSIAGKTLVFLLAGVVFITALSSFCFPKVMSDLTNDLGMKKLSSSFAVMVYNRTKDINDLAKAFERSNSANSDKKVIKLGKELIASEYFDSYATFVDETTKLVGYENYVYGNLSSALYRENGYEESIALLKGATEATNYNTSSAYNYLTVALSEKGDKDGLQKLLGEFQTMYGFYQNDEDKKQVAFDALVVANALKDSFAISKWQELV